MRRTLRLLSLAVLFPACASVSGPEPSQKAISTLRRPFVRVANPEPESKTSRPVPLLQEAEQLRATLQEAYERIVARETVKAPLVDTEASLSMPIPDHRAIRGALNYFSTDLRESIQESLLRSARYKPMIEKILDDYRLPRGLAYLPVIESAYLPTLTSKAGARGVWQFMPATAREYGLRVDWWVDERAHPELSTRAAAAYLRDLYREFGDWSLVLAAYNCGPGRVRRTLEENEATSFWQLLEKSVLPKETRGYVPTFYATLHIVGDPAAYGFELVEAEDWNSKQVELEGPLSLTYLASVSEVAEADLQELNPQYRRGIVPPGRARVRLPEEAVDIVAERRRSLKDEDPYLSVALFTLRPGDTLQKLARTLKINVEDILMMNGLINDRLRTGDSLFLPVGQRELSERLHKAPGNRYYVVRKGDTLYSIAKQHGLTLAEITDLNRTKRDKVLQPGDRLLISMGSSSLAGGG